MITVTATQGGADAQWWAHELVRSYQKHAGRLAVSCEIIEEQATATGTRKTVLKLDGALYVNWRLEHGIHRISHISQYGNGSKRQTSFARVSVIPLRQEAAWILEDRDLEISYYRGSGPGGQHRNKVMTGVRIKHIPSAITVAICNSRHQYQNMTLAREILGARVEARVRAIDNEQQEQIAVAGSGSFGGWHRSYTLQGATQQVKDWQTQKTWPDPAKLLRKGDFDAWHTKLLA